MQEAESVQKHKPQLHALYLQDAPAALADACSSTPGAASLAAGLDQVPLADPQALQQVLAGSSAAALAMINAASSSSSAGAGSSAGRAGEPNTPSSGGGLFGGGGKLLDALLGRRNSAGVGEVDKVMTISSSRRASQDCSRAATPQHSNAAVGLHGPSRTASDAAGPAACSGTGCSRQLGSCCSSRCHTPCGLHGSCLQQLAGAVDGAIAELADEGLDMPSSCGACASVAPVLSAVRQLSTEDNASGVGTAAAAAAEVSACCDNVGDGGVAGAKAKARASLPGHVAEKFDAVVELLHKLGPDRTQQ